MKPLNLSIIYPSLYTVYIHPFIHYPSIYFITHPFIHYLSIYSLPIHLFITYPFIHYSSIYSLLIDLFITHPFIHDRSTSFPTRFYHIIGEPNLSATFSAYKNNTLNSYTGITTSMTITTCITITTSMTITLYMYLFMYVCARVCVCYLRAINK